jgi:hypothetical protein
MIAKDEPKGWFVSLAFGIGSVFFIVQTLPNSSYLLLKEDGFTVCSLYRASGLKWSDIEEFVVCHVNAGFITANKIVAFNFSSTYNRRQKAREMSRSIAGCEGALPDTYGMSAEKLAELMNNWKAGIRQTGPQMSGNDRPYQL